MIVLSGADLVLPDRLMAPGSVVIDGDRIVDVTPGTVAPSPGDSHFDLQGHYVVPGFIDVHVHGLHGLDSLDGPDAVRAIASLLPRYGVTAFCPTSVACSPSLLRRFLLAVREARLMPAAGASRVLPAHLESNFLNPDYRGAQPVECLRVPPSVDAAGQPERAPAAGTGKTVASDPHVPYSGDDVLREMERGRADIGIVTLAPELPGALDLIALLRGRGHHVSLGHSSADYEQAQAAIRAGARQATHLFNRMPKMGHRHPGLVGAILESDDVTAELVCDGYHVHPAMMSVAIRAKTAERVMAITDATAGAGLPPGAHVALGGQSVTVEESASFLDDGTLAGSVVTMDRAFRLLVTRLGLTPMEAVRLCATTAARELSITGAGALAPGALADVAVLTRGWDVMQTWVGGHLAFSALPAQS